MQISRISLNNYRTFSSATIDLKNINYIVGENASGKSNLVSSIRFIRDVVKEGFDSALMMHGGLESIKCKYADNAEPISIGLTMQHNYTISSAALRKNRMNLKCLKSEYTLLLECNRYKKLKSIHESCLLYVEQHVIDNSSDNIQPIAIGTIHIKNEGNKLRIGFENSQGEFDPKVIAQFQVFNRLPKLPYPDSTILSFLLRLVLPELHRSLCNIKAYDFDTRLPKRAVRIAGAPVLDEDGNNLALILDKIFDDRKKKSMFIEILQNILPFIEDLKVQKLADRSALLEVKEVYGHKDKIPATLMSDGTLAAIEFVTALFFQDKEPIILEEPERNIHPKMLVRIVDMMQEASEKKQVIITTHNPEILRNINIQDLTLVVRDKEGQSSFVKPCQNDITEALIKGGLGLDDLFVNGMLGVQTNV